MKKIIKKEVTLCDNCNEESEVQTCFKCGIEHCYDCRKTNGVEYPHSTECSGSGDGYYCNSCDAELRATKNDKLHIAYTTIENLRLESKNFFVGWDKRRKNVELEIQTLLAKKL